MRARLSLVLVSALLLVGVAVPAHAGPGDPVGRLDDVVRRGNVAQVDGWAWDPDTTAAVAVHIYVDGAFAGQLLADRSRPDVGAAISGAGWSRGWSALVALARPDSTVCAYALNVGAGTENTTLGCARALLADRGTTFGAFDEARVTPDGVLLRGWAIDPDSFAAVQVRPFFPQGTRYTEPQYQPLSSSLQFYLQRPYADEPRDDVGRAYPAFGSSRGFEWLIPGYDVDGERVCIHASNDGTFSASTELGCRTINRPVNPIGNLDTAVRDTTSPGARTVALRGWALDYDTADSITVHMVTVGGAVSAVAWARVPRADVAAAFPGYATAPHGFGVSMDVPIGQTVCAYAINVGAGDQNTTLGCLTP